MKKIKVCQLIRVSTTTQNLERQREELDALCKKMDWEVVSVIEEIGSGAKKNKDRKAIQELKKLCSTQQVNKVIVHEISRLGRTTGESLSLIESLTDAGISVYEYQRNIETLKQDGTPNPISELIISVLASLYKMERADMIARIKSGMKSAALRGVHCGRPQGSIEDSKYFLAKHQELVNSFHLGEQLSLRKRAKLYGKSVNTVRKVQALLEYE
ncbi:MAG: recombinase family protein [Crocinitomicaceae bacterium]|nr:recombinase family protein [Crocinitomicaceae bacterium]